jgi:hypothetical protein
VLVAERTQCTTLALEQYGIGLRRSGLLVAGAFLLMARATRARRKSELALSTKHADDAVTADRRAAASHAQLYEILSGDRQQRAALLPGEPGACAQPLGKLRR